MTQLSEMKCIAIRGGEAKLTEQEILELLAQVPEWQVKEVNGEKRLERAYKLKDFAQALKFTNQIGTSAEQEDHHPLIITEWGKVTLNWWTHKIGGLHQNDFIMAAKADQVYDDR